MYCVYLTIYKGNKLPPFYIGSTKTINIENHYRGSVASKKYIKIWEDEIKNNPDLFKTIIITRHSSREEAIEKELYLQNKLNVVKSPLYINLSLARPNGFFGRSVEGSNNPMFGKSRTGEKHNNGENISKSLKEFYKTEKGKNMAKTRFVGEKNGMYGKKQTEEWKQNKSKMTKGENNPMYNKTHTEESKEKISNSRKKEYCFVSPDNIVYKGIGLYDFCESQNLYKGTMSKLLSGKIQSYKGWKKGNI